MTQALLLATDHPWRLDLVSLAGIHAAVATVLLAFFTWRLAAQTRTLAGETSDDIVAGWRPVVVASRTDLAVIAQKNDPVATTSTEIANNGKGPALNTKVQARFASKLHAGVVQQEIGTLAEGASRRVRMAGFFGSTRTTRAR